MFIELMLKQEQVRKYFNCTAQSGGMRSCSTQANF